MGKGLVKPSVGKKKPAAGQKEKVIKLLKIASDKAGLLGVESFVIFVKMQSDEEFFFCSDNYATNQQSGLTSDLCITGNQVVFGSGVKQVMINKCNMCNSPTYISTRSNNPCCGNKLPANHPKGYWYCTVCSQWKTSGVVAAACPSDNYFTPPIQWKCPTCGTCRGAHP